MPFTRFWAKAFGIRRRGRFRLPNSAIFKSAHAVKFYKATLTLTSHSVRAQLRQELDPIAGVTFVALAQKMQGCADQLTDTCMNHRHKGPFTKNGDARAVRDVRSGMPTFPPDEESLQRSTHAVRGLARALVDEFHAGSAQGPIVRVTPVLETETSRRRKMRDEAIDARQLLTVTDVCRLLRISKPTLWRIRRAGNFPDPTTVTERIFGWRRSEIDAWLASRPTLRRY